MKFKNYLTEESVWKYFKKDDTGMPFYNGLIKNPDYHRDYKKVQGEIVIMSPDEYLDRCAKIFGISRARSDQAIDFDRAIDIAKKVRDSGSKLPLPVLDYKTMNQEGRHRAIMAKRLKLNKMPVLVVTKVREK